MGQTVSVDTLGDWSLLTLWALGYGSPSAASASVNRFILVPSPDALFASLSLIFVGGQLAAQRGTRILSRRGDEAASARVFLPIFVPLLRRLALGLLLISIFAIATLLCERYPFINGAFLHVPVNFLRIFFIELVTHSLSLVFLQPSLSLIALNRALRPAAVWAFLFALLNISLMIRYDPGGSNELTGTSGRVPRLTLAVINGLIALVYFTSVFYLKMGRAALRPYAVYTILWRSLVCAGLVLATILIPETSIDDDDGRSFDGIQIGVARRDLCITFDLVFMFIQVIGFPVAILLAISADTFYWRGGARLLPGENGQASIYSGQRSVFSLLSSTLCGMGDLGIGLGLRGFGSAQRKSIQASQRNFLFTLFGAFFSFFIILFGCSYRQSQNTNKKNRRRKGLVLTEKNKVNEKQESLDNEEEEEEKNEDENSDDENSDDEDDEGEESEGKSLSSSSSSSSSSSFQHFSLFKSLLHVKNDENSPKKKLQNVSEVEEIVMNDLKEWGIPEQVTDKSNINDENSNQVAHQQSNKKMLKKKKAVTWKYATYRPNVRSPEALAARMQGITQFLRWSKERHILGSNEVVDLLMDLLDRCVNPSFSIQPRVLDFAHLRLHSLEYRGLEVSVFKGKYKTDRVAIKVATPIMALDVDLMKKVAAEADINLLLIKGYQERNGRRTKRKWMSFSPPKYSKEAIKGVGISSSKNVMIDVALPPTERTALKQLNSRNNVYSLSNTNRVIDNQIKQGNNTLVNLEDDEEDEDENDDKNEFSFSLSRDPVSFSNFSPLTCSGLIPNFLGVCCCPPDISLVYEWCSGGTLRDFLDESVFATAKIRQKKKVLSTKGIEREIERNKTEKIFEKESIATNKNQLPVVIFPTIKFVPIAASKWNDTLPPLDWKNDLDTEIISYVSSGKLLVKPIKINDGINVDNNTINIETNKRDLFVDSLRSKLRSTLWVVGSEINDVDLFPPEDPFAWPVNDVPLMQASWQWTSTLNDENLILDEDEEDEEEEEEDMNIVPPSYLQRLAFALQVSRALAYLHAFTPALLHRDIKSPNVFLTRSTTTSLNKAFVESNETIPIDTTVLNPNEFNTRADLLVSLFPLKSLLGDFGDCKPLRKGAADLSFSTTTTTSSSSSSSSILKSRTPMTRETGTPQWMAPEVMVVVGEHSDTLEELHEIAFNTTNATPISVDDRLVSEISLTLSSNTSESLLSHSKDENEYNDERLSNKEEEEEGDDDDDDDDETNKVETNSPTLGFSLSGYRPSLLSRKSTRLNTPAPFSRTGLHAAYYSTPADIFSFATILWEIVTGGTPYTGLTKKAQVVLVVSRHHARPLIPPQCPVALAQLIRRCWHPDPSCRPSAAFVSIVLQRLLEEGIKLWKELGKSRTSGKSKRSIVI